MPKEIVVKEFGEAVPPPEGEITRLVRESAGGDLRAQDALIKRVYTEVKQMARNLFIRERTSHTLQPTALVHEAYVRIFKTGDLKAPSRAYFFAAVARAMRRILIEHARQRSGKQEGKDEFWNRAIREMEKTQNVDYIDLHEALEELKETAPRQYDVVVLRFYGGLKWKEIDEVLDDVSLSTVEKDWQAARAWLRRRLKG